GAGWGPAMGRNEAAGRAAVALTALLTGAIAESSGVRPGRFRLGGADAGLGLAGSALLVRETSGHMSREAAIGGATERRSWRVVFIRTTFGDRSLQAACQAGLVNNLNDGLAWGLFPLYFVAAGL